MQFNFHFNIHLLHVSVAKLTTTMQNYTIVFEKIISFGIYNAKQNMSYYMLRQYAYIWNQKIGIFTQLHTIQVKKAIMFQIILNIFKIPWIM